MRPTAAALVCSLALAACGSGERPAAEPAPRPAATPPPGTPRPLADLNRQASRLLGGGKQAFRARLRELRGHPVVVNKWASWCAPCRAEFPLLASEARRLAGEVAFLGIDSNDNDADARRFLRRYPVPFPSYRDPKLEIAALLGAVQAFPATAFYDRRGRVAFLHQGGYATKQQLREDIERYAR